MTKRLHTKSRAYARQYARLRDAYGLRLMVPALGSTRRLQALRAIGYTNGQLAEATDHSEIFIRQLCAGRFRQIDKVRAERIAEVYRTLCVQPLHNTANAKRARAYARKFGWYPPMAWDDIDNPKDRPSLYPKRRAA